MRDTFWDKEVQSFPKVWLKSPKFTKVLVAQVPKSLQKLPARV